MMTEALDFEPWNGEWTELEDWLMTWTMYLRAACPGMSPLQRAVLFIRKMPKIHAEFLKYKVHEKEVWDDHKMIERLKAEKEGPGSLARPTKGLETKDSDRK
jgi:hypothetical protein